ncbi:MAG: SWIM zinc finger family protein [Gammaproteobacteria bacterium]
MLNNLISRSTLEDLAGSTAFQRGEEYCYVGAVERLRATDGKITAQVEGTETYQVELRDDGGDLAYDCTCPRAADGYFCKHCVAVGLAWLEENAAAPKSGAASGKKKQRDPWRDIKEYLTTQPSEALVELLLDVAQRDDRLYQSLLLKTERSSSGGNVAKAYQRAIDGATRIHGFVDWREVGTFAGNIDQVADSLAELLKPDTAAMLVDLAEYAIERVENALEQVDDSNGEIGSIVYRLGELHLKACTMARPESTGLAERLFRFETTLPFGVCSFDVTTYGDALGKEGLRRYRELAEAEWRKLKPRDVKDSYDTHRATITRIMERLAEASGNVEELVAIKSQDLSSCYRYLDIAEIWTKAKQPDKALEWAERGLKAFPERPDNRLRDFLVAAYLARKRNDEALQLTWIQFEERSSLEHYKKLHDVAGKLGLWPEQRDRALARVTEIIAREASATSHWKPKPSMPNYSLRVEIALWEQDLDAAWTAAHEGACDRGLLVTLAGKLESSRPDDAINLYRRVVPPIVAQTNNTAYEEATKFIRKVGALMNAQNQSRQFGDYLAELRVQYKPKRNFIKLLDGVARSAVK